MKDYATNDWLVNDEALNAAEPEHLDDIDGVENLVDDITSTSNEPSTGSGTEGTVQFDYEKAQLVGGIVREYFRRQRLLTYAVIGIVLYLVLKEAVKQ